MSARQKHPSGQAKAITVRLAPSPLAKLDRLAGARGISRSELITRLVERVSS